MDKNTLFASLFSNESDEVETVEEVEEVQGTVEEEVETEEPEEVEEIQEETDEQVEEPEIEEVEDVVEETTQETEEIVEVKEEVKEEPKPVYKFKDDYQATFNNYYNQVENPDIEYFNKMYKGSYENLEPLEILRADLLSDSDNSDLTPKQLKWALDDKLKSIGYRELTEDDKAELDDKQIDEIEQRNDFVLQREAKKLKREFSKKQSEFVEKYKSEIITENAPSEEEIAKQREAVKSKSREALMSSKVIENGAIKIKDRDGEISIPVKDSEDIVKYASNIQDIVELFVKDGAVDWAKFAEVVTMAKDPQAYRSELIAFGKSVDKESIVDELKNKKIVADKSVKPKVAKGVHPTEDPDRFFSELKVLRK